jgi:hypothetical protein
MRSMGSRFGGGDNFADEIFAASSRQGEALLRRDAMLRIDGGGGHRFRAQIMPGFRSASNTRS